MQIQSTQTGKLFPIRANFVRKRLSGIGRKKSVGPDDIPGEILEVSMEGMILYFARLLDITMNNNAIPGDWKKAVGFTIYKG